MTNTELLRAHGIMYYDFPDGLQERIFRVMDALRKELASHPSPPEGALKEYGKMVLKSISDTFLNPENLNKASLNDQAVIQAVGETILNYPLPEVPSYLSTPPVSAIYNKELCEWISKNYTFLHGKWVQNNEIYKHGSESHFERVSKEHGITFDELIKKYNENDNTSNRVPA